MAERTLSTGTIIKKEHLLCNFHFVLAKDGHFAECLHEIGEALIGPIVRHDTAAFPRSAQRTTSAEDATAKLSARVVPLI